VDRQPVRQPSSILSAGYDGATQTLEIEFSSKAVYVYHDVPARIWEEFQRAESAGRYFAIFIRACFEYGCVYRPPREKNTDADKSKEGKQPKEVPKGAAPKKRIIA